MIRHFFKLTWNKKKRHSLLVFELLFAYLVTSFLILFLFTSEFFSSKKPQFNIENLIEVENSAGGDTLKQALLAIPQVKLISLTNIKLYSNWVDKHHITYKGQNIDTYRWHADENLAATIQLIMDSGRWFLKSDHNSTIKSAVINSTLKSQLFPNKPAEGAIVNIDSLNYKVVGVVKDINDLSAIYKKRPHLFTLDSGSTWVVKLKKPMDNATYGKLLAAIPGKSDFKDVWPVVQSKNKFLGRNSTITGLLGGVSGFLIINVILGLFSMLYQNINRRRSEIGLRRASGATAFQIYQQIVLEVVLLSTIAMIPGVIIASQFAIFKLFGENDWYYFSMAAAAVVIYILVTICALYPAMLASKIQPADALHDE